MTAPELSRTPPSLLRRARLLFTTVALGIPLLITVAGAAVIVSWLPSFPDPVVTHWGAGGADGFGPASQYLWLLIAMGIGVPALLSAATLAAVGSHWGGAARMMGALSAGIATLGAVLSVGSLLIQRGSPAEIPGIGGVVGVAFAASALIGAAAWAVQPRVLPEQGRTLQARHAVRVDAGERVVWVGTASLSARALAMLMLLLVGLAMLAVFMLATGVEGGWVVGAVTLLVAFAVSATTAFRVRVTPEGFSARAVIGWPRLDVPLADVEAVRAVDISPFGEFGGWGWRIAVDGRTGIVMRRGSAIEVSRRGHRPFIVTIDGAEEAAALLQAYVGRARGDAPTARGTEHP